MAEFSFEDYEKKGKRNSGNRGRKGPDRRNSDRRSSGRRDFRPRNEEERTIQIVAMEKTLDYFK